jgi:uncharacterized 2Fe-2S/4Fe-4S cluster protein (DUF4445 family)
MATFVDANSAVEVAATPFGVAFLVLAAGAAAAAAAAAAVAFEGRLLEVLTMVNRNIYY